MENKSKHKKKNKEKKEFTASFSSNTWYDRIYQQDKSDDRSIKAKEKYIRAYHPVTYNTGSIEWPIDD